MLQLALLLPLARSGHSNIGFWPIFIVIAAIGLLVLLSNHLEKKRTSAMQVVAAELRLEFLAKGTADSIGQFPLGSQGHSRTMRNLMTGGAGATEVAIFDYRYTVGHGKNSSSHSATVVRFRGSGLGWPAFELRPEGLLSKLGSLFGTQDIDFVSHPVFSKMFVLKGASEVAVRDLFDEPLLSALEERKGISVEGRGDELLIFRASKQVKPPLVLAFLEEAHGIYAQFTDAAQRRA